ncbi:hypothetical protein FF2_007383 [Malus domestica]
MAEEDSVNVEDKTSRNSCSNFSDTEVNTNQRLCSALLNELNYLPWSRAVSLALGGKGKIAFVNGSIEAPDITSPTYEAWLCKDQFVMSLLLNTMEKHVAEIFSYSESSQDLWNSVKDMYGNQNNYARVFQLKKDIACIQQNGKSFVQHLGRLKTMWNELDMYLPHTTDANTLLKRGEEDKIYQLLGSLSSEYEDLRSHILMSQELPTFKSVCGIVQREEARMKAMNGESSSRPTEALAYVSNHKIYKGKNSHLKCTYCNGVGHVEEKCWILHPELKPKFTKDGKMIPSKPSQTSHFKSHHAANVTSGISFGSMDFTTSPVTLIKEFVVYLQTKDHGSTASNLQKEDGGHAAMLGQFAGFLANNKSAEQGEVSGILNAFSTALQTSTEYDYWIIDSGATDHMTNKLSNLHNFQAFKNPSLVSVANGKNESVLGKERASILTNNNESLALYVPSFPFQLLSVGKITSSLNCHAIFSPNNVV